MRASRTRTCNSFPRKPKMAGLRNYRLLLVKSPAELEVVVTEGPAKVFEGVACERMYEIQALGGPELDCDVGNP